MIRIRKQRRFNPGLLSTLQWGTDRQFHRMINQNEDQLKLSDDHIGTLLHYAAAYDNPVHTRYLIKKGMQVDCLNFHSKTPLTIAVVKGNASAVEVLLKFNASTDIVDAGGKNPLELVFSSGLFNERIFHAFVERLRRETQSIEQLADRLAYARCTMYHAACLRDINLMKSLLLKHDIHIDSTTTDCKKTALQFAIDIRDSNLIEWLVENKANVNVLDDHGNGPLHYVASQGNATLVCLCLENGANPNIVNRDGVSPLHNVFYHGYLDKVDQEDNWDKCAEILFQYGAIPKDPYWRPKFFDCVLRNAKSKRTNYLISHLAILDGLGTYFNRSIMHCIREQHHKDFIYIEEYYKLCQQKLQVKCGTLKLLDLLTMSDEKMRIYARNKTLHSALYLVYDNYPYYYNVLRRRLLKASNIIELEDTAISVLSELFNAPFDLCYNFGRIVVRYLRVKDVEQLTRTFQTPIDVLKEVKNNAKRNGFKTAKDGKRYIKKKIWVVNKTLANTCQMCL